MRTRPLADVSPRELRSVLDEESRTWAVELLWDYADVASAVAGGIERRTLGGRAVEEAGRVLAYCYYMHDSGRAIVGSLFAVEGQRGRGLEEEALEAVLAEAQTHPASPRVECQTLFTTAPGVDERFARAGFRGRARHYLLRPLHLPVEIPHLPGCVLRPLRREDVALAAEVVHRSHRGSVDAALNLTYSSVATCRTFVETLVLRSGCGRFEPGASFVAELRGRPVGVLLASRLSRRNGHVCQVSVVPESQARGVGSVLCSAALSAFRREGLEVASLSVTVDNRRAYELYRRLGFGLHRAFAAHAWVRPPARVEVPDPLP